MNRYYEALTETAARMTELAKRLDGPKGKPLTADEKQLVRLAVLPQAREQLDEALNAFVVGKSIAVGGELVEGGPLREFFRMAEDLKE